MADLVTLGFKIDTREVKGASRDLDNLKRSADGAEKSAGRLSSATAAIKVGAVAAAAAVASASAAVALLAKRGLESVDSQAKLARSLGSTTSALRAVQLAASEGGIANMEGALNRLNRRLGAAEMGVGMYAKSVQALGLDLQKLSRMDADEKVAAIADAVRDSGMSFQESARHLQQLGFEQAQANAFFRAGGDAIRAARKAVDEYGLALSAVDSNMVEQANDAWARNALLTEAVQNKLAVELAPVIKFVADLIQDAAKEGEGFGGAIERGVDIGVRSVVFMIDAVEGVRRVFLLAGQGAAVFALAIVKSMLDAAESVINGPVRAINALIDVMNKVPGVNIEKLGLSGFGQDVQAQLITARRAVREGMADIQATLASPMPSVALLEKFEETKEAMRSAAEASVEFDRTARGTIAPVTELSNTTGDLAENLDDAAKEAKDFASSFNQLRRRIDPAYAKTMDYVEAVGMLNRAWADGLIDGEEYWALFEKKRAAMFDSTEATREAAAEADPFAEAWKSALKRVDDAFAGIWTGAFDSFKDFRSSITNAFKQMLAEMAHAAITRPIMLQMSASMGVTSGRGGAGSTSAMGGGFGLPGGLSPSMLGGFGGGALGDVFTGLTTGSVVGTSTAAGAQAATIGSKIGAFAGYAPALFHALEGDWASAGLSAAGFAIGGPVGAAIGSVIGGLFGRDKPKMYGDTATTTVGASGIDTTTGVMRRGMGGGDALTQLNNAFVSSYAGLLTAFGEEADFTIESVFRKRTNVRGGAKLNGEWLHGSASGGKYEDFESFAQDLLSVGLVDAIRKSTLPDLIKDIFDGMTDPAQIQSALEYTRGLASVYQQLNAEYGTSLELTKQLVDAFGGAGGLSQAQAQYYQLFHSETERATDTLDALTAIMAQLGQELPATTAEFRALVEAQDLATESGIQMYATLMKIAPAFHQATTAMDASAKAAEEAAKAAEEAAKAAWTSSVNAAYSELQRSVNAEKSLLQKRTSEQIDSINRESAARIQANQIVLLAMREGLLALEGELRLIESASESLRDEYAPIQAMRRNTALDRLARALQTGDVTGTGEAAQIAARISEDEYTNSADFQLEQARTLNLLASTELLAGEQVDQAAMAVRRIEESIETIRITSAAQIAQLQENLASEIARLDAIIESAQRTIDALHGIDNSVKSVEAALRNFSSSVSSAVAAGANPPTAMQPYSASDTPAERRAKVEAQTGVKVSSSDSALVAAAKVLYQSLNGGASTLEYNRAAAAVGGDIAGALGWNGSREDADRLRQVYGFANGGTHMGGLRLVGERGPELESTGPSRITSNNKLMQALGSSDELVREVRALRVENMAAQRAIERNTREIKQIEQRWDKIGLPEQRVFA